MFRIIFPEIYDLSYIYSSYCSAIKNDDGIVLEGNFKCSVNKI